MASLTKLGYWAGGGTADDPYKPDYVARYPVTNWSLRSGRVADSVVLAVYEADTAVIADIQADPGVIPASARLPVPDAVTLDMPLNPLDMRETVATVGGGQTLTLAQGIYSLSSAEFSPPAGTTLQAAPGARVILTDEAGGPPNLALQDGVTLRDLWLGGAIRANAYAVEMGSDCTVERCLFFGFTQAIGEGQGVRNQYVDNAFIDCGDPPFSHAIYISGDGSAGGLRKDALVRGNLFIGCPAYSIHLWHNPTHCTVEKNLMARGHWLMADHGQHHVVRENQFWSADDIALNASGTNTRFETNVFGYQSGTIGTHGVGATMRENRYVERAPTPRDSSPVAWTFRDARLSLGRTYVHIEDALDAIEARFAAPGDALYTDGAVDAFMTLLQGLVSP